MAQGTSESLSPHPAAAPSLSLCFTAGSNWWRPQTSSLQRPAVLHQNEDLGALNFLSQVLKVQLKNHTEFRSWRAGRRPDSLYPPQQEAGEQPLLPACDGDAAQSAGQHGDSLLRALTASMGGEGKSFPSGTEVARGGGCHTARLPLVTPRARNW